MTVSELRLTSIKTCSGEYQFFILKVKKNKKLHYTRQCDSCVPVCLYEAVLRHRQAACWNHTPLRNKSVMCAHYACAPARLIFTSKDFKEVQCTSAVRDKSCFIHRV